MVVEEKGMEPAEAQQPEIEWTPYADLHLINSLGGLKAIGINHHFCMAIVWHRFTTAMHVNVTPETLRKRLETFYDFSNADKLVGEIPFPNEQVDFSLPEDEFPGLKLEPEHQEVESSTGTSRLLKFHQLSKKDLALAIGMSGKRFSNPIIPIKSRAAELSARKERKESMTPSSSSTSTGALYKHSASSPSITQSPTGGNTGKKEFKRGGSVLAADDSSLKKKSTGFLGGSLGGGLSSVNYQQELGIGRGRDSSQMASALALAFEKKLLKDSRVVLTKGKIDDLTVKRGLKIEEDKKQYGAALGKKRQARLSDTKPGSPSPTKRGRH